MILLGYSKGKHALATGISNRALAFVVFFKLSIFESFCGHFRHEKSCFCKMPWSLPDVRQIIIQGF